MHSLDPANAARVAQLVEVFERIGEEHMKDLGLYNAMLRVEAVGFRPWRDVRGAEWLTGILVTPWFMNLILLPREASQMADCKAGEKKKLVMPRGEITFTVGDVDEVGRYLSSSLYSPMGSFPEHATASTTAWSAVEQFFVAPPEVPQAGGCTG